MKKTTTFFRVLMFATVFLSMAVAPFVHTAWAANSTVTDVRIAVKGDVTRVVFDLSHAVDVKVFFLSNPYRAVIDLPEVGWRLPSKPLPKQIGIFERMRYGLFSPGKSRVVLDLQSPGALTRGFVMAPNVGKDYRLVLDIKATSKQRFASRVKQSVTVRQQKPYENNTLARASVPDQALAVSARLQPKKVRAPIKQARFVLPPRKPAYRPRNDKKVIVIDPGHGGVDPGTISRSGIYEKHITLAAAREFKRQLDNTGRYKVLITRRRDVFIQLRDRVRIARDAKADLFISLHADTVKNPKTRGASIYTLSEKASDKEAQALADKENKSDLIAGIDLSNENREVTNILIDLAQRDSMNKSVRLAGFVVKKLKKMSRVLRNTHRFAGFAVLKAPDIPSVLIELGFLSNKIDEKALRTKAYRAKIARALTGALDGYFTQIQEASR